MDELPRNMLTTTFDRIYWTLRSWTLVALAPFAHLTRRPGCRPLSNHRPPRTPEDTRYWLWNMRAKHGFSAAEIHDATGLIAPFRNTDWKPAPVYERPTEKANAAPLLILPYPGGRNPRTGFRLGALDPQRDTKISVFTPWDPQSHVVIDVPEAVWSNLGLLYLAHTHVDTLWSRQGITLPRLEWDRSESGVLRSQRLLPNGIRLQTLVESVDAEVRVRQSLSNHSGETLSALRVQNCVMLGAATGFNRQTVRNKIARGASIACGCGGRWIIAASWPRPRVWANPCCPCMHSDPQFDDCPPAQTRDVLSLIRFYQGHRIDEVLERVQDDVRSAYLPPRSG